MGLGARMKEIVYGQDEACDIIEEQMEIRQAGLLPPDRPAGIFLLYGPTGAGKTHTVEALATAIHNSHRKYLRIDCAEMQFDHEIAKLIGSPPGYMGHRETQPQLTQFKLNATMSDDCRFTIVCFDEIEKGSRSLHKLLLGILDKGRLTLGDNSEVHFEHTIVFLTSNIGSGMIAEKIGGLGALNIKENDDMRGLFKEAFDPEFLNRIDAFIGFKPLSKTHLSKILDNHLAALQGRVFNAMEKDTFAIELSPAGRDHLLKLADVPKWGARELGRVLQRKVLKDVARLIILRKYCDPVTQTMQPIEPGSKILIDVRGSDIVLTCHRASLEELLRASVISSEWRKRNH